MVTKKCAWLLGGLLIGLAPAAVGATLESRTSTATISGAAFITGNAFPTREFNPNPDIDVFTGLTSGGASVSQTLVVADGEPGGNEAELSLVTATAFDSNSYLNNNGSFSGVIITGEASASRGVIGEDPDDFIQNTNNNTRAFAEIEQELFFSVDSEQPFELSGQIFNQNNGFVVIVFEEVDGRTVYVDGRTGDFTSDSVGIFSSQITNDPIFGFEPQPVNPVTGILAPADYRLYLNAISSVGPQNFPDIAGFDVSLTFPTPAAVPEPSAPAAALLTVLPAFLFRRQRN